MSFWSEVLWGEPIGLLLVDDRWFTVYFTRFPIARFDSRQLCCSAAKPSQEALQREGKGRGRFPCPLHPIPSTRREKMCQVCARSKLSGMLPAAQNVGLPMLTLSAWRF